MVLVHCPSWCVHETGGVLHYSQAVPHTQNRELGDSDLVIIQRALMSLCDMLRNPENITASITTGACSETRIRT